MKLKRSKLSLAMGLAFSSSFLLCYIPFSIVGNDSRLYIINSIFHDMDFKPLMVNNGFSMMELMCGTSLMLLIGCLMGFLIALFYNMLLPAETEHETNNEGDEKIVIVKDSGSEPNEKEKNEITPIGFKH